MNRPRNILITGIIFFLFLVTENLSASIIERNRLFDVNMVQSEKTITYSFELSKKPLFTIESSGNKCISLSFPNTDRPEELKIKIDKTPYISFNKSDEFNNTNFTLTPDTPYKKIECAWIDDSSKFAVNIELNPDDENKSGFPEKNVSIKDIRFGFKENSSRMVIGAEKKPQWSIGSNSNSMLILLDASSENIKTKTYSFDKWLNKVEINGDDIKSTELSLNLDSAPNQIGIFWMPAGNRLVLDILKNPDSRLLALLSDQNADENHTGITEPINGEKSGNDFRNIVRVKIEKENKASSSTPSVQEEEGAKMISTGRQIPDDIKPLLKRRLPDSMDIDIDVDKLSPEEAFLFGRIRQAKEINDYDTGISLTSQFLIDYPESNLCEVLSFWRGDFYYNQWEKGDRELGDNVIKAYKYAIGRFEDSENIPNSYIKMARVASGMGDGYQALGYLGIVLSHKKSDYLPLAYLTRGKVFLLMDQPDKAIKDFKVLLQDYAGSHYAMEANLWIANYYHKIGLYAEANQKLKEIGEEYPELYLEYPEFILLNAKNNLYLKNYADARDSLFKAVNIGGQQETVDMLLSRIGDTYHNEENDKEAEKYYRMVIDYYPESEGASISKLRLAEYFSDITILDNLSQNEPNEAIGELAVLEKSYQLFESKQYDEAIKTLKELVAKPVQTETRKDAKRLFIHSIAKEIDRLKEYGLFKDLVYLYEENSTTINNQINPEALLTVAEAYTKLGRQKEAVSVYRYVNSYDLNPDKRGSYILGLADSYIATGNNEKAASFLEKGKNEKMNQVDRQKVNLLLADLYRLKGRNKDAEKLYSLVIQNIKDLPSEDAAKAYLNLGITFKARKQYHEARNAFNHSIEINLKSHGDQNTLQSAYIELGNVLYAEGKHTQAAKAFEKGFSLGIDSEDPEYWEIRFRQAMAYLKTGEDSKAETLLYEVTEGGEDSILQQRAQLKLGSLVLSRQLKILSLGEN